jgi:hypothetical protein
MTTSLNASTTNKSQEPLSRKWTVITSFGVDIDLTAHAQGPSSGVAARAIDVISGGVLVVVKPDAQTETTPNLPAGYQLKGQVTTIKAAGSGTTATAIIVYW